MEEKKAHWAVVFLMQSQRTQHPFLPLHFFPATFFFFAHSSTQANSIPGSAQRFEAHPGGFWAFSGS